MILLDERFLSGGWQKLDPVTNTLARNFAQRLPVTARRFDAYCTYHRLGMLYEAGGCAGKRPVPF